MSTLNRRFDIDKSKIYDKIIIDVLCEIGTHKKKERTIGLHMDFIAEKIKTTLAKLDTLCQEKLADIEFDCYDCDGYKENNTPPALTEAGWRRFGVGERLKGVDEHFWFHFVIDPVEPRANKELIFQMKTGREGNWDATNPQGTVYMNGKCVQALDTNHTWIALEYGQRYDVYIYFYTGMIGGYFEVMPMLMLRDTPVYDLAFDVRVPYECMKMLQEGSYDYIITRDALDKALMRLDLRDVFSPEFYESVKATSDYLREEFYGSVCGKSEAVVNCIGHTHIDVAWLWTVAQTREKAERSFSTVLNLMRRYPEYKFMSSQPQLYQHVKEVNPELYDEIKERVAEGRWEVEGAMWLEADCNLISGESFVRQILHGKRFMMKEFGVDSKVLWLPDVFGYSAALPQILKKSGVDKFFTTKISWNESNKMPNDTFIWKGIDGTEIFTHFIDTYVCKIDPSRVLTTWRNYKNKSLTNKTLLTAGYGDGGGGTSAEMLEYQRRLASGIPGMPRTEFKTAGEFLNDIEKDFYKNTEELRNIPKWDGELYLEMHRGTYTSIAKNKKNNRISELRTQEAETLSVADMMLLGGKYESETFEKNQINILLNQFHDIIPGSSIKEVYDVTDSEYARIIGDAKRIIGEKLTAIAENINTDGGVLVYNPAPYEMTDFVEADGKLYYAEKVPAHGYKVIANAPVEYGVKVGDKFIENDVVKVTFDDKYQIISVYDKALKREVISAGDVANRLEVYEDYPREYDAWEITNYYKQKMWICDDVSGVEALSNGFRITRKYGKSTIKQDIVLRGGSKRVDFVTEIDWHEDHVLLKAAFPLDIRTTYATYDVQFGNLERPTHMNTSWDAAKFEVCGHKWADMSEYDYGVSLLNDCKYGYSAYENVLKLTLLKAATYPNPEADREVHHFTYSIYPHEGDFRVGKTVKEGYLLNMPMTAATIGKTSGKLSDNFSLVSCDCENVVVETVKKAEDDDGIIVRMFDCYNKKSEATVELGFDFSKAYICDLMENVIEEIKADGRKITVPVKNYEIVSLKLVK